jgi:tetratricopeptide (TPR) repeat protein
MIELANDRWFPIVNLTLATGAAMLWYLTSGRIGWLLLVVILVPWALRIAAGHFPFRRSRFDGWLVIFGMTAVIGTLTAYNSEAAAGKFWTLLGAMAVYFAIVTVSRRDAWLLTGATGPVGALLAIYFVVSNNWRQWPAEIPLFNQIGAAWMSVRPSFPLPVLHPNTLGGMMALLLPFTLAFGIYAWRQRRIRWVQLAVVSGGITAGGLLFTSSIGAWLALVLSLGCWFTWEASGRLRKKLPFSQKAIFGGAIAMLLLLGLLLLLFVLGAGVGQEASATRLGLAQQTLFLIEDFALTGSGLATFPALYAQYIRVTPAFFVAYSNFYLDIWLEQGLFAFVAVLVILGGSFWLLFKCSAFQAGKTKSEEIPATGEIIETQRKRKKRKKLLPQEMSLFQWAAFSSLAVMALHGLIDDALYGGQASPLLFFAPAMVILVTRRRESAAVEPAAVRRRRWALGVGATAVLLIALFWGFRQKAQAQWYANLGALELARVELIGWPTNRWDTGTELERFDKAANLFERALTVDAHNRTANQRKGMIAMVGRDYETAVIYLEQAEAVSSTHRGIAKSLGYSYVWRSQFDEAVQTLAHISESRSEMAIYSGWWQRQNRPDLAAKAREIVAILENAPILMP